LEPAVSKVQKVENKPVAVAQPSFKLPKLSVAIAGAMDRFGPPKAQILESGRQTLSPATTSIPELPKPKPGPPKPNQLPVKRPAGSVMDDSKTLEQIKLRQPTSVPMDVVSAAEKKRLEREEKKKAREEEKKKQKEIKDALSKKAADQVVGKRPSVGMEIDSPVNTPNIEIPKRPSVPMNVVSAAEQKRLEREEKKKQKEIKDALSKKAADQVVGKRPSVGMEIDSPREMGVLPPPSKKRPGSLLESEKKAPKMEEPKKKFEVPKLNLAISPEFAQKVSSGLVNFGKQEQKIRDQEDKEDARREEMKNKEKIAEENRKQKQELEQKLAAEKEKKAAEKQKAKEEKEKKVAAAKEEREKKGAAAKEEKQRKEEEIKNEKQARKEESKKLAEQLRQDKLNAQAEKKDAQKQRREDQLAVAAQERQDRLAKDKEDREAAERIASRGSGGGSGEIRRPARIARVGFNGKGRVEKPKLPTPVKKKKKLCLKKKGGKISKSCGKILKKKKATK
jgi:hypothetical protein